MRAAAPALALVLAAACSGLPESRPLRGPAPATVLVLPVDATRLPRELVERLDSAAHLPFADRGYGVIPVDVARNMLAAVGVEPDAPLSRELLEELQDRYAVDAVLLRRARRDPANRAGGFVLDLELIAVDGTKLWDWTEAGGPGRGGLEVGAASLLGNDPMFSDEPALAERVRGQEPPRPTTSLAEQVDAVQRRITAALPPRR